MEISLARKCANEYGVESIVITSAEDFKPEYQSAFKHNFKVFVSMSYDLGRGLDIRMLKPATVIVVDDILSESLTI